MASGSFSQRRPQAFLALTPYISTDLVKEMRAERINAYRSRYKWLQWQLKQAMDHDFAQVSKHIEEISIDRSRRRVFCFLIHTAVFEEQELCVEGGINRLQTTYIWRARFPHLAKILKLRAELCRVRRTHFFKETDLDPYNVKCVGRWPFGSARCKITVEPPQDLFCKTHFEQINRVFEQLESLLDNAVARIKNAAANLEAFEHAHQVLEAAHCHPLASGCSDDIFSCMEHGSMDHIQKAVESAQLAAYVVHGVYTFGDSSIETKLRRDILCVLYGVDAWHLMPHEELPAYSERDPELPKYS